MLTHCACLIRASYVTCVSAHACITVIALVEMLTRLVLFATVNAIYNISIYTNEIKKIYKDEPNLRFQNVLKQN